jgi:ribonuclease P protein component
MGLSRKSSLRSSAVIGRVIGRGRVYAHGDLKLHVLPAAAGRRNLFAFAVPKYGHCIVERNRLKRRLQEIVRNVPLEAGGRLLVLRCRPSAYERRFDELKETYSRLVDRIAAG